MSKNVDSRQKTSKYVKIRLSSGRAALHAKNVKIRLSLVPSAREKKQVIRDFQKTLTKPGRTMGNEELSRFQEQLQAFCSEHRPQPKVPPRISACIIVKGLDHALQRGAKLSLRFFENPHVVARLKPEEDRFYRTRQELPAALCPDGVLRRACIIDKHTRKTRLELIRCDGPRHRLHCRSDRGSVGWTQWFPLFSAFPTLGSFWYDSCHKFWDDDRLSCTRSGLGWLMTSLLLCVNLGKAPWKSHSFQHQLRACSSTYFSQATIDDPFFLEFYDKLRSSFDDPFPYGTVPSLQATLAHWKACPFFKTAGADIKWSRWYSIIDRLQEMLGWWWPYTSMVVLLALQKGVFKNMMEVYEVSMKHYDKLRERIKEASGSSGGGLADGGGRPAMRNDDSGMNKSKGVLQVAATTLAAVDTQALVQLIVVSLQASRREHGEAIVRCKTQRGCLFHVAAWANSEWEAWLNQMAGQLSDSASLRAMGFSSPGTAGLVSTDLEHEAALGHFAWLLKLSTLGSHLLSMLGYVWCFPMCIFVLVHKDEAVVRRGLAHLKNIWCVWQQAERVGHTDDSVDEVLHNLVWTSWQWPRMVCLELDECEWQFVPEALKAELTRTAMSPQNTKLVEDVFREPRAQETASANKKVSRYMRWHRMVSSQHSVEADRPGLQSTHASKTLAKSLKLPAGFFDAEGGKDEQTSLPPSFFSKVIAETTEWRSPSANNFSLQPLYLLCLAAFQSQWGLVDARWQSNLCIVGSVIQHKTIRGRGGVVILVSDAGCLVWRLTPHKLAGQNFWELRSLADGRNWDHLPIVDYSEWSVCSATGVQPSLLHRLVRNAAGGGGAQVAPDMVLGRKVGEVMPLEKHSCLNGFPNMTVPMLKRLWSKVIAGRPPAGNTAALVEGLAKAIVGNDVDVQEILRKRDNKDAVEVATPLTPEVLQTCVDAFDVGDFSDVQKAVGEAAERAAKRKRSAPPPQAERASQARVPAQPAPAGSASSSSAGLGPRLPVHGQAEYTVSEVRQHLPPGFTIRVSRETHWHTRWRAQVVGVDPPNSVQKSWGGRITEFQAIMHVLANVWAICHREGGPPCPYPELRDMGVHPDDSERPTE